MQATTKHITPNETMQWPAALRWTAQLLSFIFHPLFIPIYVTAFLLVLHPSCFSGYAQHEKMRVLAAVAVNTVFFPGITVLLLKALRFIDSIMLHTQKDRIIPYIASGTFYFWTFWVMKNNNYPQLLTAFMLGVFINAYAALIVNIYQKISMHGIGIGALLGIGIIIMLQNTMLMTWPLAAVLLIGGLVCTARLIVSNHRPKEVYLGLLLGFACQVLASFFV